jgi:hypothetical protein
MPGARHSLPAHVTERLVAGSFGISLAIAGFPTPPASAVMLGAARTGLGRAAAEVYGSGRGGGDRSAAVDANGT